MNQKLGNKCIKTSITNKIINYKELKQKETKKEKKEINKKFLIRSNVLTEIKCNIKISFYGDGIVGFNVPLNTL